MHGSSARMRALLCALACAGVAAGASPAPHLIVTLVDDLGGYNVPWRNPEQGGARLKDLVEREGVQLERFYTYKFCSPTRSSLLSGRLPYHVNEYNAGAFNEKKGGIHPDMTLIAGKLKTAGYATAMIGKGHIGARNERFLPINRGFDHHLGFLGGGEDHNTQINGKHVDLWHNTAPAYGRNGTNSCYLYTRDAVAYINAHDASTPLFMYLAFQNVHSPYQALPEYIDETVPSIRRNINGMMNCVADATVNVTDALKAKGMWGQTLLLWSADNGGPQYWQANNWPLRGGKGTDFEGGVRGAAFAAGGLVHASLRGTKMHTVMHVADVYTTFCRMGGLSRDACEDDIPGLPGVDGLDMSAFLTGPTQDTQRPNPELVLSFDAHFNGDWKYIVYTRALAKTQTWCNYQGNVTGCGYWTNPSWPTEKTHRPDKFDLFECENGCIFNVVDDPSEYHDQSQAQPELFARMKARHMELVATAYQTNGDFGYTLCVSDDDYAAAHKGFKGPPCVRPE